MKTVPKTLLQDIKQPIKRIERVTSEEGTQTQQIKACPFCGKNAAYAITDEKGVLCSYVTMQKHVIIKCNSCGARTKPYLTKKGAFNAWNKRNDPEEEKRFMNLKEAMRKTVSDRGEP